jgi:integrase
MVRPRLDRGLLEGEAIVSFREAVRSRFTLANYERALLQFLRVVSCDVDGFVGRAKRNPKWAERVVTEYLLKLKARVERGELQAGTLGYLRKPIRLLLEMNDVDDVNWKKISRLMPSERRYALDRVPTIEEIRVLLSDADIRLQVVLLVMASGGVRLGAWDYLDWGHVQPVEQEGKVVAAKLIVYRGQPEEYVTFITPEAYERLKQYIQFRQSHGEAIDRDSPLMRDRFQPLKTGSYAGDITNPKRLASSGVKRLMEDAFWRMGIRKEKKKRHEFSIHSFRKFFKTRAEQVMRPINVETLMGHSTGISDSYYRPTEKELLEDYLKAVPLLTVSEVEEVRRESQLSREQMEGRLRQLEDLVSRLTTSIGQQALSQSQNRNGDTGSNNRPKRVVTADEVEALINQGWDPLLTLPNGKVVVGYVLHDD